MFKLAHLSDLHLGYKTTRRNNSQGINLREADGYISFSRMISEIIENDVDAVVIAGDIFHIPTPEIRTILFAQNQLRRLWAARIPVYMLAGNHDTNDIKSDIAASRLLHDPSRKIFSHIEPYVMHTINDGINLHLVSHHMYSEQGETMKKVKATPGEINIFSTHGSVIDPLLKEKLHTEQSPREIVIPDFLMEDQPWDYTMLGHIHERGWVGSKDGSKDSLNKKIFYNGSLIRRGFADKECKLERGWTLWSIDSTGIFTPEHKVIAQRPQIDFPIIDSVNKTAKEITDQIIENILTTQNNTKDNIFDPTIAPILRQRIVNLDTSKRAALDWANIQKNSRHAFSWSLHPIAKTNKEATKENSKTELDENFWKNNDIVKMYDEWIPESESYSKINENIKTIVKEQARNFVELGQEKALDE